MVFVTFQGLSLLQPYEITIQVGTLTERWNSLDADCVFFVAVTLLSCIAIAIAKFTLIIRYVTFYCHPL